MGSDVPIVPVMPIAFIAIRPAEADVAFVPEPESAQRRGIIQLARPPARRLAGRSAVLVGGRAAAVFVAWLQGKFAFDVNTVILMFLIAGIALHGSPVPTARRCATRRGRPAA